MYVKEGVLFRFAGRGPRPTYWVRRFENTDNPAFCFTDKGCEWINEGPRPPLCVHLWVCVHTHTHTHTRAVRSRTYINFLKEQFFSYYTKPPTLTIFLCFLYFLFWSNITIRIVTITKGQGIVSLNETKLFGLLCHFHADLPSAQARSSRSGGDR